MQVARQIVLTLAYSQIFSQPLTTAEIERRLIYSHGKKKVLASPVVIAAIEGLRRKRVIRKKGEHWLMGHVGDEQVRIRKKRKRMSDLKIKELSPLLDLAQKITWVRGVALTGSVSVENADATDDVELRFIVQPQRLWLVRPVLVIFSFLLGKRRSWNHEESNSWCLNLWLEEDRLKLPRASQTIYTAYEVCQVRWMVDKDNVAQRFLESNTWVRNYLPAYYVFKLSEATVSAEASKPQIEFADRLWNDLNSIAYAVQRWYMNRHMTREKVTKSVAFFHPRDTRSNVMQSWKDVIGAVGARG